MRKDKKRFTIIIPIVIYIILSVCITLAARSSMVLMLGRNVLPVSSFAGVISAFANTILVAMVVIYRRRGFIVAVLMLILQAPTYILVIVKQHSLSTLPGLFSSIFTVIMFIIIHQNHVMMEKEQKRLEDLFEQTSTALVNAIDAKDTYTQGHSSRVAMYSKKLAEMDKKKPKECEEIYYAALLHDVGKIGISESIITKQGKLNDEEYEAMKEHPALGAQILQSISVFPYLSVGANGHHERYDGKGYPLGLKGTDIPEMARIIAVADAYDAMTSKRSYRDPIPQQIVREEIVKGVGTQFDPHYARLMLQLIDIDTGYKMRERLEVKELAGKNELDIGKHRSAISDGIYISPTKTYITVKVHSTDIFPGRQSSPSMILFDSLDERYHDDEKQVKKLHYFEYGELWFDGRTTTAGARLIETEVKETSTEVKPADKEYKIEAVRIRDHALVRIIGNHETVENIIALPDSTRFVYIGITGEQCHIEIDSIDKADSESPANYIRRIANEISYIDVPDGDIPNVQIDGYRTDSSRGVVIKDGLKLNFHTKSLPTARLVWHCPFVLLFTSDDGKVNGRGYRELAIIRFDGEAWECDDDCSMERKIHRGDGFDDWDTWKEFNKGGYDATVTFKVQGDKVTITTENYGISICTTVIISGITKPIYTAITGDQVAITNIHIS